MAQVAKRKFMKILITGASGFIGSTLIEETLGNPDFLKIVRESTSQFSEANLQDPLDDPLEIAGFFRKSSQISHLDHLRFERIFGDFKNLETLREVLPKTDVIIHLAGTIFAPQSQLYYNDNTESTVRFIQYVRKHAPRIRRFVFISSLAAGGPMSQLESRREIYPDKPVSDYGKSKLLAEAEILKFKSDIPIVILRPPIVYGPRDKSVLLAFQTVAKGWMPIPRSSQSSNKQKYYSTIYSKDLCAGILQAALASVQKIPSGEIFYLSGDGYTTYQELLETIGRQFSRRIFKFFVPQTAMKASAYFFSALSKVTKKPYPLNSDKLQELIPDYWICSNQKAKDSFGFKPLVDLETGISEAFRWYKKQNWL